MAVERLSTLDECFLRLETRAAHLHVGWTLLLDGEPPTIEELRTHVAGRLELLPRFRRRVMSSPLRLHDPVWVDDSSFAVENHVHRIGVPGPGGPAQLRALAGRLLSIPLDRRRPLWRLHLLTGLREGRCAIVGQAHHALVDGVAALEMAQLLLDSERAHTAALPARRWEPAPAPGLLERAIDSASLRARLVREAGSVVLRTIATPQEGIGELRRVGAALAPLGSHAPRTILNRRISSERSLAYATLPLGAAHEIGRRLDATVGDVILTTTSLALGRYLRRAGQSLPWLRALVPVSTRDRPSGGGAGALGNELSAMFVELPIAERDPRLALAEVQRQTHACKQAGGAGAFEALLHAAALVPSPVRDVAAWMLTRPQTFNTVVSNIPGPREPLYLLGRRVRAAYPAVPLAQGHGLSIGVLSYCGRLHVGLYAHPGVVPSVVDVARDVESAFDALRLAIAPTAPGGRGPAKRARLRTRRDRSVFA